MGGSRGERVDGRRVAAHRGGQNAANRQPGEARGKMCHDEGRVDRVAPHYAIIRAREPEACPHQKEEGELSDDEHARADKCPLCVSQSASGQ